MDRFNKGKSTDNVNRAKPERRAAQSRWTLGKALTVGVLATSPFAAACAQGPCGDAATVLVRDGHVASGCVVGSSDALRRHESVGQNELPRLRIGNVELPRLGADDVEHMLQDKEFLESLPSLCQKPEFRKFLGALVKNQHVMESLCPMYQDQEFVSHLCQKPEFVEVLATLAENKEIVKVLATLAENKEMVKTLGTLAKDKEFMKTLGALATDKEFMKTLGALAKDKEFMKTLGTPAKDKALIPNINLIQENLGKTKKVPRELRDLDRCMDKCSDRYISKYRDRRPVAKNVVEAMTKCILVGCAFYGLMWYCYRNSGKNGDHEH